MSSRTTGQIYGLSLQDKDRYFQAVMWEQLTDCICRQVYGNSHNLKSTPSRCVNSSYNRNPRQDFIIMVMLSVSLVLDRRKDIMAIVVQSQFTEISQVTLRKLLAILVFQYPLSWYSCQHCFLIMTYVLSSYYLFISSSCHPSIHSSIHPFILSFNHQTIIEYP